MFGCIISPMEPSCYVLLDLISLHSDVNLTMGDLLGQHLLDERKVSPAACHPETLHISFFLLDIIYSDSNSSMLQGQIVAHSFLCTSNFVDVLGLEFVHLHMRFSLKKYFFNIFF